MISFMISLVLFIIQVVYNIFSKNKIHYDYPKLSNIKVKDSKIKKAPRKNYKEEQFDKEAELWGLPEEDKRIAKEERMSPADFIEAEERDDDELITDEWEENK